MSYGENEAKRAFSAQVGGQLIGREDRTIGENIDARIAQMEEEIKILKSAKEKLSKGVALTDMKPGELCRAIDGMPF